jgi:hypothetical protein
MWSAWRFLNRSDRPSDLRFGTRPQPSIMLTRDIDAGGANFPTPVRATALLVRVAMAPARAKGGHDGGLVGGELAPAAAEGHVDQRHWQAIARPERAWSRGHREPLIHGCPPVR